MTNKEMINRIKDIADCADAAYVKLDYVFENIDAFFDSDKWNEADDIRLGNQTKENDRYLNGREILPSSNTAYARCIEARFMQNVVIEKGTFKDTTINNDPKNVSATATLSTHTKNFVNRYELIEHQPNADYGFSATLFKDTQAKDNNQRYILAIRGTEITLEDLSIDITLARNGIPMQCYELARFYEEQIKKHLDYKQKLTIVGHSLGGYLAQSFCFMYPDRVAELYTFNSPGLLGAWNKDLIDNLLSSFEVATYVTGIAGAARKIGFKLLAKSPTTLKVMSVLGVLSLTINIKYATWIPKELRKYSGIIKYLIKNIKDSESREGKYMPYPLDKNNHYHIEATNTLDFEKHMSDTTFYVNLIQHLGTDIAGNYYPIYLGNELSNSHFLAPMLNVLYFYSYLLELESNAETLQVNDTDISQSIERLNTLSNAIHRILEDISFQEATGHGEDLYIPPTPHYLYATIDKTLFEATLHTKQKKLQVDMTTLIEGILYLQDIGIFLQLLTKESMQEAATDTASRESNLAILLAIHERLFFISVLKQDNQAQALIQTKNDITTLLKHNTTRTQIFCYNLEHIDEKLMRGYLNDAFRFYPFIDRKKVA